MSSWGFTAEEVIALLDQQEEFEHALGKDLDAETEDDDHPEGNCTDLDGTQSLVQPETLASHRFFLVAEVLNYPELSQRDSLLLNDQDLFDDVSTLRTSKCEI